MASRVGRVRGHGGDHRDSDEGPDHDGIDHRDRDVGDGRHGDGLKGQERALEHQDSGIDAAADPWDLRRAGPSDSGGAKGGIKWGVVQAHVDGVKRMRFVRGWMITALCDSGQFHRRMVSYLADSCVLSRHCLASL
jgi:hypothetical protein